MSQLGTVFGCRRRHVFLTVCCWQRQPLLATDDVAWLARDQLLRWGRILRVEIRAYTLMPDHAHVLVCDTSAQARDLMQRWKQATGYGWRRLGGRQPLWQRGFDDRVLAAGDDPAAVARHIVMNPVRAGLAPTPEDYPFSGLPAPPA